MKDEAEGVRKSQISQTQNTCAESCEERNGSAKPYTIIAQKVRLMATSF